MTLWKAGVSRLRFFCPADDLTSGYGRIAAACIEALDMVRVGPQDRPDFVLSYPGDMVRARIRFTMWEPDDVPPPLRNYLDTDALIVPCASNVGIFRRTGFRGPIAVVPLWGAAPPSPMPTDDVLRFLCVAREAGVPSRKGIDQLLECFGRAFPRESDVQLTVKSWPDCRRREPADPRIAIRYETLAQAEYDALLAAHHCGVFLSGLEAWNFPACELMAAGRPSLVVPYGGPAEYTTTSTSWHLPYELVAAPDEPPYYACGRGARALDDGVIAAMREVYRDRAVLRAKAAHGRLVAAQFTREHFTRRLRDVVSRLLSGTRRGQ